MRPAYRTKLLLAFRSGDICAFPGCERNLTVDGTTLNPVVTGVAAHIAGEKPGSARYDSSMKEEERNHDKNLIYLCGDHHTQIDKQEADYTVARLHEMKADHERKVRQAVTDAFAGVGFPELEEATKWVMKIRPCKSAQDFTIIPPEDKLKKNDLGYGPLATITMGLSVAREVGAFIESVAQTESSFPEKLKAGFLTEYYRLRREGYSGDDLFDLMCGFAQRGFFVQAEKSAGLAVLIYLFERCEVFEK